MTPFREDTCARDRRYAQRAPWPQTGRNRLLLHLDQFILALVLLVVFGFLAGRCFVIRLGLMGLDDVDAHLAEFRQDVLDLLGLKVLRR